MESVTTTTAVAAAPQDAPEMRRQVVVGVILTVALLFVPLLLQVATHYAVKEDFTAFYTAGLLVRSGQTGQLYHSDAQTRVQAQLHAGRRLITFIHPPFEALAAAPFTAVSYSVAYLLWGVLNIGALVLATWLLAPWCRVADQPFRYMLLVFAFSPVWLSLIGGEGTALLLLFLALAYVNLQKNRDIRAGLWLALGLARFQIVLPLALLLLLKRKWKVVASFSAGGATLGMVSLLMVGWAGLLSYTRLLIFLFRHPIAPHRLGALASDMPNFRGILTALLPHWMFGPLLLLLSGVSIAVFVWPRHDHRLDYPLAIPVALLLAPHLHVYDLSLMVLAIIAVLNSAPEMAPRWRNVMYASAAVLYLPPLYFALWKFHGLYLFSLPVAAFSLATIVGARSCAMAQAQKQTLSSPMNAIVDELVLPKLEPEDSL